MKRIAVFGKPGSGKSTLSKKLASATGIKLYALDSILYKANGDEVDRAIYDETHERILYSKEWIIEGFGPMDSLDSFNRRLEEADTLIYIDLPYRVTYWFVTKRLLKGLFVKPEGWPDKSSVLKGGRTAYSSSCGGITVGCLMPAEPNNLPECVRRLLFIRDVLCLRKWQQKLHYRLNQLNRFREYLVRIVSKA